MVFCGILLIIWFVSKSDIDDIWSQLQRINIKFIILIAVTFLSYMMIAVGWRISFPEKPDRVTIIDLFIIRLIGESLSQINPTNLVAGETLKAYLLKKRGISYHDSIVSLTISRISIILSALTLVLIGAVIFFNELLQIGGNRSMSFAIPVLIGVILFIVGLTYYLLKTRIGLLHLPIIILRMGTSPNKSYPRLERVIDKMTHIDQELIEFFETRRISFVIIYLLSLFHWVVGALEMYCILLFIGIDIPFLSCVAVEVGVMVFKALGAFVPGQVGIEEMANKIMLDFVHVPSGGIWITVSILRRARQIFWIILGFAAFIYISRIKREFDNGSIVYNT